MSADKSASLSLMGKAQFFIFMLVLRLLRGLGFKGIYHLGGFLGLLCWVFCPSRRHYAVDSVQRHLGVDRMEAGRIAKASFGHCFRSFMELPLADAFRAEAVNKHLSLLPQSFLDIRAETRPVVAFTAHLGGWELLAGILDGMRPDYRRIVVVRSQRNPAMNALIHHMRGVSGVEVTDHRHASAAILRVLRENGTTAFLVDHNTGSDEALFLPFLGETAAVNQGPALLALRGKAVLYAVFLIRKPDATYEIHTAGPFDASGLQGSIAERSRQIAEFYTRTSEEFIRRYPEQWFWMHRRWKTRPPEGKDSGPT